MGVRILADVRKGEMGEKDKRRERLGGSWEVR